MWSFSDRTDSHIQTSGNGTEWSGLWKNADEWVEKAESQREQRTEGRKVKEKVGHKEQPRA